MRILIAEDDAILADGLVYSLRATGYSVDRVATGIEADTALSTGEFDLLILDLGLPKLSGFEVLKRLRGRKATIPVLILTALDGVADRVRGLDLGADDYLSKPFERSEFEARVRALLRRGHGALAECGALKWSWEHHQGWIADSALVLTKAETHVLEALLRSPGRIVTKAILAERAAMDNEPTSDNSVEVYVYRLRRKLEPSGVKIKTVRGLGYLLQADA